MKIMFEAQDYVDVLRNIRDDLGAYFAARAAEIRVRRLPWSANGQYVEAMFDALVVVDTAAVRSAP